VGLVVGAFRWEAKPDGDTRSSCLGRSGDRVLDVGSGSPPAAFQSSGLRELSRSQPWEAHHQPQDDEESQVKEFKGKISKIDGRFVLEESSDGGTYGTYLLDDQTTASKYEGERVTVRGTLDALHKTIRVRKIEAVA
jgi:hypothetical protein